MTPKERRAQMIKERGKTKTTGISPKERRAQMMKSRGASESRLPERIKKSREDFNKKVAASNKRSVNQDSVKKFKAAEESRKARIANLNKVNPKSPRARLERQKQLAAANKITSNIKKTAGATATATTAAGAGSAAKPKASVIGGKLDKLDIFKEAKPSIAKKVMAGTSEFGKAFAKARKEGKKDFTFRDKQYAAITKQEVQKAGASGLGDYLNKLKRKDTKIVQAKLKVGGSVDEMAQREARMERQAQREARAIERQSQAEERRRRSQPRRSQPQRQAPISLSERERERLEQMSGAAISENEMKSFRDQMMKRPEMDAMKKGGSVMARGCKLGRKKATKIY
jgi:hypothetical protein